MQLAHPSTVDQSRKQALAFFAYAYTIFGILFLKEIIEKITFNAKVSVFSCSKRLCNEEI